MLKIFFLILTFPLLAFATGGTVGDGGDLVYCEPSTQNPFNGIYNLDYLANVIYEVPTSKDFDWVVGKNDRFDKNFLRLLEVTQYKYPKFYQSLKDFHSNLFKTDLNAPYFWKKAPYGLPQIDDEHLRLLLPQNCLKSASREPFFQAVIRSNIANKVEFFYDVELFKKIENLPLQKSFLLFHEWLWGFTDNPEIVRNANAILHSRNWTLSEVDARIGELARSGLNISGLTANSYPFAEIEIRDNDFKMRIDGVAVAPNQNRFTYKRAPRGIHMKIQNYTDKNFLFLVSDYQSRGASFQLEPKQTRNGVAHGGSFCVYFGDRFGGFDCNENSSTYQKPQYLLIAL